MVHLLQSHLYQILHPLVPVILSVPYCSQILDIRNYIQQYATLFDQTGFHHRYHLLFTKINLI